MLQESCRQSLTGLLLPPLLDQNDQEGRASEVHGHKVLLGAAAILCDPHDSLMLQNPAKSTPRRVLTTARLTWLVAATWPKVPMFLIS